MWEVQNKENVKNHEKSYTVNTMRNATSALKITIDIKN